MDITQKAAKVAEKMGMDSVCGVVWVDTEGDRAYCATTGLDQDALAHRCLREMYPYGWNLLDGLFDNGDIFDAYIAWKEGR